MNRTVDHIDGLTFHGRKGAIENAFRYSVDYVMLDAEALPRAPRLFRRNTRGLFSLWDRDHGGAPGDGVGAGWVRQVLADHDLTQFRIGSIELLAQPRVLGHVFNPVSFWIVRDAEYDIRVVIPEVTNTYGDRHSYLCFHDDLRPISREDLLTADKVLHVSPYQNVSGEYQFRFDIGDDRIGIWIDYTDGNGGLLATLTGRRRPLSNKTILRSVLRRPFGSRRVLALIHWQALKLWRKGADFQVRPEPPVRDVSR